MRALGKTHRNRGFGGKIAIMTKDPVGVEMMLGGASGARRRPRDRAELEAMLRAANLGGTPQAMRAGFETMVGPQPPGMALTFAGVPCRRFGMGEAQCIWLHGGGYVFGSARTYGMAAEALAVRLGSAVIVPDYRLAPEHPWPAMLDDALAVVDGFDGEVGLVGDGAGGHLALQVALAEPQRIRAMALISPNTDRTGASRTRAVNSRRDLMNDEARDAGLAALAMRGVAPDDPVASPHLGDLSALPPTYLAAAADEVLLDDALLLARAAGLAGVDLRLRIRPGLFHMWTLWPDVIPEAAATLAEIASHLGQR